LTAEIVVALNAIEDRGAVQQLRYRDFELWPLMRFMAGHAGAARDRPANQTTSQRTPRVGVALDRVRHTLGRLPLGRGVRPSTARLVVLTHVSNRQVALEGGYFDIFADPLVDVAELIGLSAAVWAYHDRPSDRPAIRPVNAVDGALVAAMASGISGAATGLAGRHVVGDLEGALQSLEEYGLAIDRRSLLARAATIDAFADRVARWFSDGRTDLAAVVSYYTVPGLGFVLGAHRAGVRTVDLQHGVQGPQHVTYGRWSRRPTEVVSLLPDYYWCWSETDARWMSAAVGADRGRHGGHLLGWAYRTPTSTLRRRLSPESFGDRRERELLITLQPGVPVADAVVDAMRAAPPTWRWWVRPHPSMTFDEARAMVPVAHVEAELERAAERPLHEILDFVDLHITAFSSVVLEAAALGLISAVTDPRARALYTSEIARGAVLVVDSASDILRAAEASTTVGAAESAGDPVAVLRELTVGRIR
jgi:hypothetical protein